MNLQSRTVKILALLGTALLIVTVGFVVVVAVLVRDAPDKPPSIEAYANGKTVSVAPYRYCTINLEDCTESDVTELDVRAGYPLQLSLPKEISDAPWRIVMVFQRPDGQLVERERYYSLGETSAVTVKSEESPPWRLNGVEIQLPSAVVDDTGAPRAHAVWSIKTA